MFLAFLSKVFHGIVFQIQSITSSFQAVLVTDGQVSYAVFIYECGSMNWGGATIGWADSNSLYQRHSLSGSDSATVGCQYSSTYSAVVYRLGMYM